jgi:hypothetical protein
MIMTRFTLRASLLALLLAGLAVLSASAQTIPAGSDFWTTPANGQTYVTIPPGDVEAMCGLPPSTGWDHKLAFQGVPLSPPNPAYDTVVARLSNAVFDSTGTATTRVQVKALSFASSAPQKTPCGSLTWQAGLAGAQGTSTMVLHRTTARGGYFNADLNVRVELRAFNGGSYIGSLFYDFTLPDPGSGTPWSFGSAGEFRAGMTETNNCLAVLRQKLSTYATDSSHYYYISDMIARGQCTERN